MAFLDVSADGLHFLNMLLHGQTVAHQVYDLFNHHRHEQALDLPFNEDGLVCEKEIAVREPDVAPQEGKYVRVQDTVRGFKEILDGKHDDIPEQAFMFVGTIEEALAKAKGLEQSS